MQGCCGRNSALKRFPLLAISIVLGGCLEQDASTDGEPAVELQAEAELQFDHELSGSVGDGPIVGATMRVLANDGTTVATLESDSNAGYNVTVRAKGKFYPLTVVATQGTDLVTNLGPDFDLFGAVVEPGSKSIANLNPFSTFALELARVMNGGITKANLAIAEAIVTRELNSGLDGLAVAGPMKTPIDASNIAEVTYASETLGETVRRIRDLMNSTGRPASGDSIVRGLAADLVDGVIDGRGGPNADPRMAALAVVVSAQTALEAMQLELHVNGQVATGALESAMDAVAPNGSDRTFSDLGITANMLEAVRVGLDAGLSVMASPELQALADAVSSIDTATGRSTIRSDRPNDLPANPRSGRHDGRECFGCRHRDDQQRIQERRRRRRPAEFPARYFRHSVGRGHGGCRVCLHTIGQRSRRRLAVIHHFRPTVLDVFRPVYRYAVGRAGCRHCR